MKYEESAEKLLRQNDELRAQLMSASARTELLVSTSEEFFGRREMIRAHLGNLVVSVKIERGLGVVKESPSLGLSIDLDRDNIALSDITKLGSRILAALAKAEQKLDEITKKALGPLDPNGNPPS